MSTKGASPLTSSLPVFTAMFLQEPRMSFCEFVASVVCPTCLEGEGEHRAINEV